MGQGGATRQQPEPTRSSSRSQKPRLFSSGNIHHFPLKCSSARIYRLTSAVFFSPASGGGAADDYRLRERGQPLRHGRSLLWGEVSHDSTSCPSHTKTCDIRRGPRTSCDSFCDLHNLIHDRGLAVMFAALRARPLCLNNGRQAAAVRAGIFIKWLPGKLKPAALQDTSTSAPFDHVFRLQMCIRASGLHALRNNSPSPTPL